MSKFSKIVINLLLIVIAGAFLYFSFKPNEIETYQKNYFSFIDNIEWIKKLKDLNYFPLSERDLAYYNSKNIYVNYPQKSFRLSLQEIGISFDNRKKQLVNGTRFEEFQNNINKELSYLTETPSINLETNEFYALGRGSTIKLDSKDFLEKVSLTNLNSPAEIRIFPKFSENFIESENKIANQNLRLLITSKPLTLKAGRMEIPVSTNTLESFIESKTVNKKEILKINTSAIERFLVDLNSRNKFPTEVNYKASSTKLANHLLFRITEENPSKTFILPINGSYSIRPTLHQKFAEVNKSQQRTYLFENGELKKTLNISTGVTWETPTGTFKVLNKVPMTISYHNNWYMPWYLPLGTINGSYYFGFHEVPYHMDYNGMIYSRDPETIGSPATGGCIQVLKGQAKELFDWAEVGMPVYITE